MMGGRGEVAAAANAIQSFPMVSAIKAIQATGLSFVLSSRSGFGFPERDLP